jgi:hypothetical protein
MALAKRALGGSVYDFRNLPSTDVRLIDQPMEQCSGSTGDSMPSEARKTGVWGRIPQEVRRVTTRKTRFTRHRSLRELHQTNSYDHTKRYGGIRRPERSEPGGSVYDFRNLPSRDVRLIDQTMVQCSGFTGDSMPSEARKRGSGGGSPRKYDGLLPGKLDLLAIARFRELFIPTSIAATLPSAASVVHFTDVSFTNIR